MPAHRSVSVLIPARDEERTITGAVHAAYRSAHPIKEVIVCDDQSSDETPRLLERLSAIYPTLRVIHGEALPPGWVGKPWACHRLAEAARGDLLLYVDADTFLMQDGIERLASLFAELDADLVTAVPRQLTGTTLERLILPLLHLTYLSWFPIALTWRSRDARFLAANGQLLAITREAYERAGGFEAVRDAIVDDMALCRRVKRGGDRVVFADGHRIASCRMYQGGEQVWEGFSKNIYPGLGARPAALLGVVALYVTAFISPYASLLAAVLMARRAQGRGDRATARLAALGVANNLALRALLAARHGHTDLPAALLHPLGVAGLLAIAVNSARWYHQGAVRWSGRTYQDVRALS